MHKYRIVFPDGTGRDFTEDLGLKVGDKISADKVGGLNGYIVYSVRTWGDTTYYAVS